MKDWKIDFNWINIHAGHHDNELADQLAKEAALNKNITESYSRIPKSAVISELCKLSIVKWQYEWDQTPKAAITKSFFPSIAEWLKQKIKVTPNFTTIVTGHGNIKSYLFKYKIIENPVCPCNIEDQTVDHLLYNCKLLLDRERDILKSAILKTENWPVNKNKLTKEYLWKFTKFVNNISLDKLQWNNPFKYNPSC